MEEKFKSVFGRITLVIWLLGILITVITVSSGFLYSAINQFSRDMGAVRERLTVIQEDSRDLKTKIQQLDQTDQRIFERLDKLERNKR